MIERRQRGNGMGTRGDLHKRRRLPRGQREPIKIAGGIRSQIADVRLARQLTQVVCAAASSKIPSTPLS